MEIEHRQIDILKQLAGLEKRLNDLDLAVKQTTILNSLNQISARIEHLEQGKVLKTSDTAQSNDIGPVGTRVLQQSKDLGFTTARMYRVPSDYYSWELEQRR